MGNYRTTLPLFYCLLSFDTEEYLTNQECTFTYDQMIDIMVKYGIIQINDDPKPPEKSLEVNLTEAHQNKIQIPIKQTIIQPAPFKIAVPALKNILIQTALEETLLTIQQVKIFLGKVKLSQQSHAYLLFLIRLVGQINKQNPEFLAKYKENLRQRIKQFLPDTPKRSILMAQALECFTISSKIDLQKIWMVGKINQEMYQQISLQQTLSTNYSVALNTRGGRRRTSQNPAQKPQKIKKTKIILKSRRIDAYEKYEKKYKGIKRNVNKWVLSKKDRLTKI